MAPADQYGYVKKWGKLVNNWVGCMDIIAYIYYVIMIESYEKDY